MPPALWPSGSRRLGPTKHKLTTWNCSPAELGDFGDRPDPNQGFFFTYERFDWTTSRPESVPVGKQGLTPTVFVEGGGLVTERTTVIQAVPKTENSWGNRFELGYMVNGDGWILGVTEGFRAGQIQEYGRNTKNVADVTIVFADPDNLLSDFVDINDNGVDDDINGDGILDADDRVRYSTPMDILRVRDVVEIDSVELMKMHRFKPLHRGGVVELYGGARFLKYNELFQLIGTRGLMGNMLINTQTFNDIIGPQIGLRYSNTRERWTMSVEGRFLAGANFQGTRQEGNYASLAIPQRDTRPRRLYPNTFNNQADDVLFSPVGELRLQTAYNVTKNASFKLGWTGTFIGGIARATNQVDYTLPSFGILADSQHSFTHGVSVGFEVNR